MISIDGLALNPATMMTSSSNQKAGRRVAHTRAAQPDRMRETANDHQIVRWVYDYRLLTQKQIERLLGRSRSTVQRLLRRLYDHRYLDRVFLPVSQFGSSPAVYVLDRRGLDLLRRAGVETPDSVPNKSLSGMFLEHALAINEVRIAVSLACKRQGWSVVDWLTESDIKADYDRVRLPGHRRPVALVPDSYFCIAVPERGVAHCFLELDRGTMTTDRFRDKAAAYVAYYRSGDYARRFEAQGFRVLTVVDGVGSGRVTSLTETTAAVHGIGRRFWFTHIDQVDEPSVLNNPIWQIAGVDGQHALFD